MVVGAMTDPKGDRSKGPAEQVDPDQYVHIVERRADGIVIRGAKLHMTGGVNSHEILVMPTTAMDEKSKDYAVVCAIPIDAPGLTMIFGRQANDDRRDNMERIDVGKPRFGRRRRRSGHRLRRRLRPTEHGFSWTAKPISPASLVYRFAAHHRANYGACKTGLIDVLTGAVAYLAQIQGTAKAPTSRTRSRK